MRRLMTKKEIHNKWIINLCELKNNLLSNCEFKRQIVIRFNWWQLNKK